MGRARSRRSRGKSGGQGSGGSGKGKGTGGSRGRSSSNRGGQGGGGSGKGKGSGGSQGRSNANRNTKKNNNQVKINKAKEAEKQVRVDRKNERLKKQFGLDYNDMNDSFRIQINPSQWLGGFTKETGIPTGLISRNLPGFLKNMAIDHQLKSPNKLQVHPSNSKWGGGVTKDQLQAQESNTPEQVIKQPTENMSLIAPAANMGLRILAGLNNKNKAKGKQPDFSLTGKSGIDWANQVPEGLETFSQDDFVKNFGADSGYVSDIPVGEQFKNVDWSNLDTSSPYSGVTAQAMAQNELRKGGFDPYAWNEPAFGQETSLLGDLTNKIRTGPDGLAAVQEQLKPQPTAPLKPFGGVTAQAAGQNELRKGGVDPYAGMGDPSNPNNQLLTEVTNQIRNTGSADGAGALVSSATGDPNNLLTAAQPYRPGGAKNPTEVISPPLGGDPPLGGTPPLAGTPPAGGGMTTQGGGTTATSNQSSGFGGSFDDFMKFMMMMNFMGGGMGGGQGGYGGSQYGYGGLNPGGVQQAHNPFEQVQSSWDWVNKNFGGSGSSPVTTNSTNI